MWKVKRMNTARIVVLTIANGAGGIAAFLASGPTGLPRQAAPVAPPHAMQTEEPGRPVRPTAISSTCAVQGIRVVRYGAAGAGRRCRRDRKDRRYEVQGKSADDADIHRPRPVVFGRRSADAQSGPDAGGGGRLSHCRARCRDGRPDERAPAFARDRQIHRDRPAARHQGCAGRRSQDRQRRRPLRPARLYHRRGGRPDQHRVLRFGGPADRGL